MHRLSIGLLGLSFCLIVTATLSAQTPINSSSTLDGKNSSNGINISRSHAINDGSAKLQEASGTLNIVAIRVEFQPDTSRFTSGKGVFGAEGLQYFEESGDDIRIDPLPHDSSYFDAHFQFADNYFRKVSDEQLSLNWHIMPGIVQLDTTMGAYSPTGKSFTNEKLANFARDTWQKVEEMSYSLPDMPESDMPTAFVILHAGVGRDIELTGTTLDKTPRDIPSIYLGSEQLGPLLDNPGFNGFSIGENNPRVNNTMIIPRTLSRRGEDVTGEPFVLQLSINGLLTASIGSHLGLPDLFNTETGDSGIGRFGLMDGAAFFSYSGLFPPEPSAWEKIFLGWEDPFNIDLGNSSPTELPAVSMESKNQESVIGKHAITPNEYFLVENRHRDPQGNGATLTFQTNEGEIKTRVFTNRDSIFTNQLGGFDTLFPAGVLTKVDNYDWSLPGGLDIGPDDKAGTEDDRVLNGGMLIWHIDEAVIQRYQTQQAVNANPDRRGVDLEEADGAQDIGNDQTGFFGGPNPGGSPYDFWWEGNNYSVITRTDSISLYDNRFSYDTTPNNNSNAGSRTFFEFYNFSTVQPVATLKARRVSAESISKSSLTRTKINEPVITNISEQAYPKSLSVMATDDDTMLVVPGQNSTHAVGLSSASSNTNSDFNFDYRSATQPLIIDNNIILDGNSVSDNRSVSAWSYNSSSGWTALWETDISSHSGFISSSDGNIIDVDFSTVNLQADDGSRSKGSGQTLQTRIINQRQGTIKNNRVTIRNTSSGETDYTTSLPGNSERNYLSAVKLGPDEAGFALIQDNALRLYRPDRNRKETTLFNSHMIYWPAIGDINGDGVQDFLFVDAETSTLQGFGPNGAVLSGFPIEAPEGSEFVGTPLLADINNTPEQELLVMVEDSLSLTIEAYSHKGKKVHNFSLPIGKSTQSGSETPLNPVISKPYLFAADPSGSLNVWKISEMDTSSWPSQYGPISNYNKVTGYIDTGKDTSQPANDDLLIADETYNWPNPADKKTNMRFQVARPAEITIKIITYSGNLIYNRTVDAQGGAPEEIEINTEHWGSGAYFAVIKAKGSQRSQERILKIAVVH